MKLDGRTALVTGAGSGLGRGIAIRFAAEGATVVAADIDLDRAQETTDMLGTKRGQNGAPGVSKHESREVDVASGSSVERLIVGIPAPDVIVNCAGINAKVPFLELTEADWDKVVGINLKGTFLVGLHGARVMNDGGSIINISSVNADLATPEIVHYAASKGGVRSLTKAMAVALADRQIRVNAIAPGPCETNLTAKTRETPGGTEKLLNRVALKRLGTPEDIAGVALFLASSDASFITGSTVYADGGLLSVR